MTHNEVRNKYLEFFKKKDHKEIPSAPLVPENDPTTLFTSSGMQPLIPYLLGEKHQLGTRLVNSQKCFRSQDIEEIGDNRHTTFFEMLGNWSLGDYFKQEQLSWIWQFLTEKLNLKKDKLFISIFEGTNLPAQAGEVPKDNESTEIWKSLGVPKERIFYYGVKKNWWSRSGEPDNMPPGEPGGPDSEVFFDFGAEMNLHEKSSCKDQKCHPNCDCGRFLEIANSVFMQYQKQANGTLKELPKKNVDFGGGLERMVAATIGNPDIFQTDLYSEIIETIYKVSGKKYSDDINRPTMRIIADHLKAATFMVAEGVEPSNKQQGYILRRLLRRAAIKLRLLTNMPTTEQQFLPIVESVLKIYESTQYFKKSSYESIEKVIAPELFRFTKTLDHGLHELERHEKLNGKIAFELYQSYGFPLELTIEIANEKKQSINKQIFEEEFSKHKELSRTAAKGMFKGGLQDQSEQTTKLHTATHLLQQALRTVLGDHVHQKGSNITAERLRFDFSHPAKMTEDEIRKVEELINIKIGENFKVSMEIISIDEARKKGALTVPGVVYPDKVKVYSIDSFSKEVCGGPHVDFTGRLGKFKIIKEESASADVRRIYAILEN